MGERFAFSPVMHMNLRPNELLSENEGPLPGPSTEHLDITNKEHHDARMRTTVTLDPDVAARLRQEMRRTGDGLKVVINRVLRLGFGTSGKGPRANRFEVRPHAFGFKPGIDLDRLNQLVDELDVDAAARKLGQ